MSVAALVTRRRMTRLGAFASAQLVVQVIGFASGIALVRYMDQSQYGNYTLAISMVGLGNVMLDLGLATAVIARGGAFHAEPGRLSALLGDAFVIQRWMLAMGAMLLLPVFAAMFVKQGLDWGEVIVLTALVLFCTAFNVRNAVVLSLVRLRGDLSLQQGLEVGINFGKLLLVLLAAALCLNAQIAIVLNVLAAAAMFWLLRRYLARSDGCRFDATREHMPALKDFVWLQAPNSIYYCFMGQIAIWLVGFFGSAERVAEVGALGRLAALFTVIGAVVGALIQPYFARASAPRELVSGFLALNAFFAVLSAALAALALTTPQALLWILGHRYAGLDDELLWMVLAASLSAWSGALYAVGAARGWVVPSILLIPSGLATLAWAAWALDVSTVEGSFKMNSAVAFVAWVLTLAVVSVRLRSAVTSAGGRA
jgi:O-antigen/teichoic acid export membrane protein